MQSVLIQNSRVTWGLAAATSMLASYAAFLLAERLQGAGRFWSRRLWITAAATVLGLGMWSTHFFGALEGPNPDEAVYSLRLVVLSLLVAVSASWMGFRLVAWQGLSAGRMVAGSIVFAVGACALQMVGIEALSTTEIAGYSIAAVGGALALCIGLALLAVWMTFGEHKDPASEEWMRLGGGAVMGVGFAAMHLLIRRGIVMREVPATLVRGHARGSAVGQIALLVTVGLVLLVTLGTAAMDKQRYRELARLHGQLAASQEAVLRSEERLREANARLSELSIRDGLTGLFNRRRFDQVLEIEWRRSLRSIRPVALLMIDVDCFKALNDTYGHQRGDECLREVAAVLEGQPRRSHDIVARFGGEEFVVLLPGADASGAMRVAENIRLAVELRKLEHRNSAASNWVTVSVGVSSHTPQPGEDAAMMLYDADMALYMAKQLGRNRVELREAAPVQA